MTTNLNFHVLALYGTARQTDRRDDVIAAIRAGLKARSAKSWSVSGGRGPAWGWLTIRSPKARTTDHGYMSDAERTELANLLGLSNPVHPQGVHISDGRNAYREYLERSAGLVPTVHEEIYWD